MGASASVVEAHGFETVFANADTDGSGKLNHAEFEVAARKVTNLREPEAVDAMFRELDVDKDGLIKLTELVKACVREAKKRSVSPTRSPAALKALTLAVRTLYPPPNKQRSSRGRFSLDYHGARMSVRLSLLIFDSCLLHGVDGSGLAVPQRSPTRVRHSPPNSRQEP